MCFLFVQDHTNTFVQNRLDQSLALHTDDLPSEEERAVTKVHVFDPSVQPFIDTVLKEVYHSGFRPVQAK